MSLPSLDHFNFREYEHFYEPAEDTYLLIDALQADADFLRDSVRPNLCLEIGYGRNSVKSLLNDLTYSASKAIGCRHASPASQASRYWPRNPRHRLERRTQTMHTNAVLFNMIRVLLL